MHAMEWYLLSMDWNGMPKVERSRFDACRFVYNTFVYMHHLALA